MQSIDFYRDEFISYLESKFVIQEPVNLYEPINYILKLGGKRLRPVLALLTAEVFDGSYKEALDAALAIEVFHNFSLVHDDIMDAAPVRRGKLTVHEKWDTNTGILSGDAMLIYAYQLFENYKPQTFRNLAELFSKTALQVCEGQQYDVDFEAREDVTLEEYLRMIEYKTAVLVAAAMKMGGIVAGTSNENQELIYNFGLNLGIAFQLQDDYLDAFGDPKLFGKQVGGDIIENKKTYLFIKAIEAGSFTTRKELIDLYSIQPNEPGDKIDAVKGIFVESGAAEATQMAIENYTKKAFEFLDKLNLTTEKKSILREFGDNLMRRRV